MSSARDQWRIPLARPEITDADRQAVLGVLEATTICLGPEARALELAVGDRLGRRPCAAVSNGTAALYLALRALGVDGGDVITPSYGFIGTVHAIRLAGARPRFAEVSPETLCVTAETLEAAWTPETRAIIPVHLFGTAIPMRPIVQWAARRGIPIIEDSCEALGAIADGSPAGAAGDASTFAFYANKQVTTGEGGIVAARDARTIEHVLSLRNQGRGAGDFEFVREGFNFRLTEMQAALGRSQLGRLDEILVRRERIAGWYEEALSRVAGLWSLPPVPDGDRRSWFVYPVFVAEPAWRAEVRQVLATRGIQTGGYFPAIHSMKPYADAAFRADDLRFTEWLAERSFALPFHNTILRTEVDEVVAAIESVLRPHRPDILRHPFPTVTVSST